MALYRFIVVILLACVVCPTASSQSRANDVRVMSYNIRYGIANDGENHGTNGKNSCWRQSRRLILICWGRRKH